MLASYSVVSLLSVCWGVGAACVYQGYVCMWRCVRVCGVCEGVCGGAVDV